MGLVEEIGTLGVALAALVCKAGMLVLATRLAECHHLLTDTDNSIRNSRLRANHLSPLPISLLLRCSGIPVIVVAADAVHLYVSLPWSTGLPPKMNRASEDRHLKLKNDLIV